MATRIVETLNAYTPPIQGTCTRGFVIYACHHTHVYEADELAAASFSLFIASFLFLLFNKTLELNS
jgi:hypothetical protein